MTYSLKAFSAIGVGLLTGLLAACGGGTDLSDADSQKGIGDNYGNPPALPINCSTDDIARLVGNAQNQDDPPQCTQGKFEPKYYNVVYLKFREDSGQPFLIARHAYFPVSGDTDDVSCALEFLRTNGLAINDCNVFTDSGKIPDIRYNFEDWSFGSQQRIYVVIDNDDVGFNHVTPMLFTKWGAFDNQFARGTNRPTPKSPNKSFGGAMPTTVDGLNALYFENYYRKKNGDHMPQKPGPADYTNYSINFNLVTCKPGLKESCNLKDEDHVIPIIVDPDTNNGLGLP